MQTNLPITPNPFPWRRFANVFLGERLLGEDTEDMASLGFCGEVVAIACPHCGELLGNIPTELCGEEFADLTTTHITPALDWHRVQCRPRLA